MYKKQIFFLILLSIIVVSYAQTETKLINGSSYSFVTVTKDDTEQSTTLEIYQNDKKLLSHLLESMDGDCSSENIELGDYEISNNNLTLYTYWASGDRMQKNIYPFGFRKEIYTFKKEGTIELEQSNIYIEDYVDSYTAHEGIKLLKNASVSETECKLIEDYTSKAEKMYDSHFVVGTEKENLEHSVRTKLKSKITENTSYWKEVYGDNCNM